jgi:hypothetical protein
MENYILYRITNVISANGIRHIGAAKLGEGLSKMLNLTSLNLNFE